MHPLLATRLRRAVPLLVLSAAALVFVAVHLLVFRPLAERRAQLVARATARGIEIDPDPSGERPPLPPRVYSLLMDNSLPAPEADARGQSGSLAAEIVQRLSSTASRHGLEVLLAEPGLLSQTSDAVEARAHLKLRGSFDRFTAFLDDLAGGGRLWAVERFSIVPNSERRCDIELSVSAYVLKRARGHS